MEAENWILLGALALGLVASLLFQHREARRRDTQDLILALLAAAGESSVAELLRWARGRLDLPALRRGLDDLAAAGAVTWRFLHNGDGRPEERLLYRLREPDGGAPPVARGAHA